MTSSVPPDWAIVVGIFLAMLLIAWVLDVVFTVVVGVLVLLYRTYRTRGGTQ